MKILTTSIFIVTAIILSLNLSRFCYLKRQFISDHELIKGAIGFEMKIYESRRIKNSYEIKYSTISDFLDKNPNCCSLKNWWEEDIFDALLGKMLGYYISQVRMKYKLYNDEEKTYYNSYILISSCSKIVGRRGIES